MGENLLCRGAAGHRSSSPSCERGTSGGSLASTVRPYGVKKRRIRVAIAAAPGVHGDLQSLRGLRNHPHDRKREQQLGLGLRETEVARSKCVEGATRWLGRAGQDRCYYEDRGYRLPGIVKRHREYGARSSDSQDRRGAERSALGADD